MKASSFTGTTHNIVCYLIKLSVAEIIAVIPLETSAWVCSIDGMRLTGKNWRSRRRKPIPGPLCPPWISHKLAWNWTRSSAAMGWQLTAWYGPPHTMTEVLYVSTEVYWPHITYLIYASKSYCNKVEKYKRRLFRASKTSFCSSYGRLVCLCSELIWTVNM